MPLADIVLKVRLESWANPAKYGRVADRYRCRRSSVPLFTEESHLPDGSIIRQARDNVTYAAIKQEDIRVKRASVDLSACARLTITPKRV